MGLSFHYNGSFKREASLAAMIEEVKDIAEVFKWKHHVFENEFPDSGFDSEEFNDKIYGISFTPPECETVDLCFLSNGKMSSAANLMIWKNPENPEHKNYIYMLSTKTQFAGIEIHKSIIHLLKYITEKYFHEFNLMDEGNYWKTLDENILKERFARYNLLLNMVEDAIATNEKKGNESFEDYFARILKDKGRE